MCDRRWRTKARALRHQWRVSQRTTPGDLGWAATGGTAHAQAPALTSVVHAPAGDVQGLAKDGVGEFLGIPYAAPPVGELRWRPPEDAPRWQRPLQATKFGNTCMQPQRGVFAAQDLAARELDCRADGFFARACFKQ